MTTPSPSSNSPHKPYESPLKRRRILSEPIKKEVSTTPDAPPFPPPILVTNDDSTEPTNTIHTETTTTTSNAQPTANNTSSSTLSLIPYALPSLTDTTNSTSTSNASPTSTDTSQPPPPSTSSKPSTSNTNNSNNRRPRDRVFNTYAAFLNIVGKIKTRIGPLAAASFEWMEDAPHSTTGGVICKSCDACKDIHGYFTKTKIVRNYNTYKFLCHCKTTKHYKNASSAAQAELSKLDEEKLAIPTKKEVTTTTAVVVEQEAEGLTLMTEAGTVESYEPPVKKRKLNEDKLRWSAQEVGAWIASLGTGYYRYAKAFESLGITGAFLDTLSMEDLVELVQSRLLRKNILFQWKQI
mmetsp:Transcript_48746/g.77929  ORF Transcript_48746/g.77929 Transcript_48746/m.77929 type:complete len:352 (-) Transcript_48746:40-1095(-)